MIGIVGGLLYPNVQIRKERTDPGAPYGLVKINLEAFGYRRAIVIRDKRAWPYMIDWALMAMSIPVGIVTFRAWEMTAWKPGKAQP